MKHIPLFAALLAAPVFAAPVLWQEPSISRVPSISRAAAAQKPSRLAPLAYRVAARLPDKIEISEPSQVQLNGYLGTRVVNNQKNRLLAVDENDLLDAFERRDVAHQPWQGEHVGKFLHAATLAWVYSGDAALKSKLDRVVARLLKTQEADGYLGTYAPKDRWTSWDVWSHKYNLIGLLTYYRYTGDVKTLQVCRRIGDVLIATFPAKKSIIAAGEHMGMAATSVLEPMVLLYRSTGDARYLDFARYILRAWDEPNGPKVLSTLLRTGKVNQTANGKAYEMLSNLVGLCELARATGESNLLVAVEKAWQDIVDNQLYITGTTSHHEHFHADHELPDGPGANMGETCVTTTWIQLNAQLLSLTGQSRFADQLECSYYNHLAGAQRPDGAQWCYYTPLRGAKPYGNSTNCCLSSGPRALALLPEIVYTKYFEGRNQGVAINLFETSRATLMLGGQSVVIEQASYFPFSGNSTLTLRMKQPATFGIRIRTPQWAMPLNLRAPHLLNKKIEAATQNGWTTIAPRRWKNGDSIAIEFNLSARTIVGDYSNAGKKALMWGPLVLAYDEARDPDGAAYNSVALTETGAQKLRLVPVTVKPSNVQAEKLTLVGPIVNARSKQSRPVLFVPFAEAGGSGSRFVVWMTTPETMLQNASLLAFGRPSQSRIGNASGDIGDGDQSTFVVSFDGKSSEQDWFAITLDAPTKIKRVVFAHGRNFQNGGWFDASMGKPQIQVQHEKGGAWQTVGALDDYPATTATDNKALQDGQAFALRLPAAIDVVAVRAIGQPAGGDNPKTPFASCAELQAFAD